MALNGTKEKQHAIYRVRVTKTECQTRMALIGTDELASAILPPPLRGAENGTRGTKGGDTMTTDQLIERLKPARAEVMKSRQRLIDKLETGVTSNACTGYLDHWRKSVKLYLAQLDTCRDEVNREPEKLVSRIDELTRRLDRGFSLEVPDSAVDAWKLDKHFDALLTELMVCCDIHAGPEPIRTWLLAQDAELRKLMRRNDRPRPAAEQVAEMEANA